MQLESAALMPFNLLIRSLESVEERADLVVDYGHVKIAKLLQSIRQVGMCLCHLRLQDDASIIESYALLEVAQLVVNGANQ